MENKLVSHRDMELVKMAMLRHEETFRQQVHELHRLYRVQRQLMSRPSPELSCRRQTTRRRRRQQPRRALDLRRRRLPADECVVVTPPSSAEDGLELTLAIGGTGTGRCRMRRREETETDSTGTAARLGSESDISGGSLTASSTDTGGSPPYQRAMPPAFRLQEATTTVAKQPPRSPWLVQCASLEMARGGRCALSWL